MRKITFMVGAAAGFLVGSRAGTGPYEQVEGRVRQLLGRDDVRQKVEEIKTTAKEQAAHTAHMVADKVPGVPTPGGDSATAPPSAASGSAPSGPAVPTPIE